MFQKLILFGLLLTMFSCHNDNENHLEVGTWRAEMQLTDTEVLPFNFKVINNDSLQLINAEETIDITEITYTNDSVRIQMPVFEGYIKAVHSNKTLNGSFIIESLDRVVPFSAKAGEEFRFKAERNTYETDVTGSWETLFSPDSKADSYVAKGIFQQEGQKVTGTFRTTTGDYRYLEGIVDADTLKLSTFDGAHAFLFKATVTDSTMSGMFYSGNHWQEPFTAKRNDSYELPDADSLTFLREGYDKLEFSFPNTNGGMVSLADEQFKDKVVIVQIMGSWCPNCLDESRYYSQYYRNNKNKDLKFVALAFEYSKTKEAAFQNINRLREKLDITYPILLAQYGSSSKTKANDKLPMLNQVLSYPTSIFIDKTGRVRKIHTGFNGPATGEKHEVFKHEFEQYVDSLLNE